MICETSDRPHVGDKVQLAPGVEQGGGPLKPGDVGTLSIITAVTRVECKQLEDRRLGALSTAYNESDIVKAHLQVCHTDRN